MSPNILEMTNKVSLASVHTWITNRIEFKLIYCSRFEKKMQKSLEFCYMKPIMWREWRILYPHSQQQQVYFKIFFIFHE